MGFYGFYGLRLLDPFFGLAVVVFVDKRVVLGGLFVIVMLTHVFTLRRLMSLQIAFLM